MLNAAGQDEVTIGVRWPDRPHPQDRDPADRDPTVAAAVTALYETHAVGFLRLAVVMLGDSTAAEDVVQDAFCGLYRRWRHLDDPDKALQYVRSAVLNGCRSQLRARIKAQRRTTVHSAGHAASAEDDALVAAEHHEVLTALRGLPARQREALVLRFYLDLSEPDIATAPATRFYKLSINPAAQGAGRAVLTVLAAPVVPAGTRFGGMALSPDGTRLAVAQELPLPPGYPGHLRVYDLATGRYTDWAGNVMFGSVTAYMQLLSWEENGRFLTFVSVDRNCELCIRRLDTSSASGSLDHHSVLLLHPPVSAFGSAFWNTVLQARHAAADATGHRHRRLVAATDWLLAATRLRSRG